MGRPIKKNADYFSHTSDLRNDQRVKGLRRRFSHTGYSCYTMLREMIAQADYFHLAIDAEGLEIIADELLVETELLRQIIEYCIDRSLLHRRGDLLTDHEMIESLSDMLHKRKVNAADIIAGVFTGVSASETLVKSSETLFSDSGSTQIKVKENKNKTTGSDLIVNHSAYTQTDLTPIDKLVVKLKNEREWLEAVMMQNPGINDQNIDLYLQRFVKQLSDDATQPHGRLVSFRDKKKHFRSWLPIHLQHSASSTAVKTDTVVLTRSLNKKRPRAV